MAQWITRFALALTVLLVSAGVAIGASLTVYTDQGESNTLIDVTQTTGAYQYLSDEGSDTILSMTPCAIADVLCVANGGAGTGTTSGSESGTAGDMTGDTDGALNAASDEQALPIAHAPEPATLLLFGSGLVFGALTLRRRRSRDSKHLPARH